MKLNIFIYLSLIGILLSSCAEDTPILPVLPGDEIENPGNIQEITALPNVVNYPLSNPQTQAKEELGQLLFWDPILSGNLEISCASCHHPDFAYADGLRTSIGIDGVRLDRNSPTIINAAFNGIGLTNNYNPEEAPMFWDNRTQSLEAQSIQPILSAVEMRGNDISEDEILNVIIERLKAIPEYVSKFQLAFGNTEISGEQIAAAISTFERSIVAGNSRFDQYMRGNINILSQRELDGLNDFIEVGCADCHSGAMLSDFELHTLSVPNNGINDTGASGIYDFRTPTLRNISLTAPYMHNGAFESLNQVLNFYNVISRGNGNSRNINVPINQIANEARNLNLNNNQINNIVQFLGTLTDTAFDKTFPIAVPSELPVGGESEN